MFGLTPNELCDLIAGSFFITFFIVMMIVDRKLSRERIKLNKEIKEKTKVLNEKYGLNIPEYSGSSIKMIKLQHVFHQILCLLLIGLWVAILSNRIYDMIHVPTPNPYEVPHPYTEGVEEPKLP